MKKRSFIAICICLTALCGCSDKVAKTVDTTTSSTTTETQMISEPEVTTTTITALQEVVTTTTQEMSISKDNETTTTTQSEEEYTAQVMQDMELTQADLILEKPADMEWEDYLRFCRYMKVNGMTSGQFTKKIRNPNSSMAFIPSKKLYEVYPGLINSLYWDVYQCCTLESVREISSKRFEELSTFIHRPWCAKISTNIDIDFWTKDHAGLTEDGEYCIIRWDEELLEYVDYWLVLEV